MLAALETAISDRAATYSCGHDCGSGFRPKPTIWGPARLQVVSADLDLDDRVLGVQHLWVTQAAQPGSLRLPPTTKVLPGHTVKVPYVYAGTPGAITVQVNLGIDYDDAIWHE